MFRVLEVSRVLQVSVKTGISKEGEFLQRLKRNRVTITAEELAKRSRETYDTVDHWEGEGLIKCTRRGRTRLFPTAESLKRCKQIRELRDEGKSLATIKRLLAGRA